MITVTKSTIQLVCRFSALPCKRAKLKCLSLEPVCGYCLPRVRIMTSSLCCSELKTRSHEDFRELISDSDTEKRVKIILMEFMLLKQTEDSLPDELEKRDMVNLLDISSRQRRKDYILKYIRSCMKHELANAQKQEKKRQERDSMILERMKDSFHLVYGLNHNCLHFRIRENTVRTFYAQRLAQAAQFGPALVFDCGFEDHMKRTECMKATCQLQIAYGINFVHRTPFDLYFCNLRSDSSDSTFLRFLERRIPNLWCPSNMITVSNQNYLDLFPNKRKFIYLSPDAQEVMTELDEDAVYIIGAFVDMGSKLPLTMAKAKKEGIKCLKLPLDRHFLFKPGACKSLPLNQVTQILLELRLSGDWSKALSAVARRAVYTPQELADKAAEKTLKQTRSVSSSVLRTAYRDNLCIRPTHVV